MGFAGWLGGGGAYLGVCFILQGVAGVGLGPPLIWRLGVLWFFPVLGAVLPVALGFP